MKNGTEQGGQLKKITPYNENLWLPVWPSILFVILPDKRVQQWSSHPGLCWHICCSAQNLPPTRYYTQLCTPATPSVFLLDLLTVSVTLTRRQASYSCYFTKVEQYKEEQIKMNMIFFCFHASLGKWSPPSSAKSIQQKPALLTYEMDIETPFCWNDVQEVLCELFQFAKGSSNAVEWSKCQSKSKSSLRLLWVRQSASDGQRVRMSGGRNHLVRPAFWALFKEIGFEVKENMFSW